MSRIQALIPPQAFELVRDRIGEILTDELENQVLHYGNYDCDVDVYKERGVPLNLSELPMITVAFANGTYDGQTVIQSDGTYTFFIDGYYAAKTSEGGPADTMAMTKLNRLLGVCRAILDDAQYLWLGFEPPFIMSRHVSGIAILDPLTSSMPNMVMGRLTITVKVPELGYDYVPSLIEGYETMVRINTTDQGYKYQSI